MGKSITFEQFSLYRSLFRARTDVFARFWVDFSGKKSGYKPVYSLNHQPQALTDQVIESHLTGKEVIGVYPLFSDNTTALLAFDFDGENWLETTRKVTGIARSYDLPLLLERSKSGNGSHLWFFFEEMFEGYKARQLGKYLLSQAGITNRHTFDRMFPSADEHKGKGYGNLICLPLCGQFLKQGNTAFIDEQGKVFPDQWQILGSVKKIAISKIDSILNISINHSSLLVSQKDPVKTENSQIAADEIETDEKVTTSQGQETKLVLSSSIFIPNVWLPDKLYRYLKQELNFPNPEFYEKERLGYSTWQTPRFIRTLEIQPDGVLVPIGFLEKVMAYAEQEHLTVTIDDRRITTKTTSFPSKLILRKDQQKVLKQLIGYNRVILNANPGFGKTMVALALMKKLRQRTLIIVHTNTLLHQWHKRISDYFKLSKDDIGLIGDNKWKVGKKITIASYMTLFRRGIEEIKNDFGLVIIDECHHVPANTFSQVVKQFPAKYVLGLSATAYRKDKLDKLMYYYLSDQIVTAEPEAGQKTTQINPTIETQLVTRKTQFKGNTKCEDFQEASRLVIADKERNEQIVTDIAAVLATGAKCLVLSERLEHCKTLLEMIRQKIKGVHAAVATGIMTKKQRERIAKRLHQDRFQLLIATGKLIGEGFDWPEVSHLFLAFPFSWKGKLIQYIGRVQRPYEGKTQAVVHDYFDDQVSMLKIMYYKRLRTYRSLGLSKLNSPIKKKVINEDQLSLF